MRPLFAFFAGLLLLSCGNKSNTSIEKNGPKEEEILSLYKLYTSGNYNAYVDAMQSCDDKPETYDPLVIDLNNDGIKGTNLDYKINFDLDNNGFKEATSWIDNNDAFIAIDKNNNGTIDNGSELFGNKSISNNAYAYTNPNAKNGFESLKELDSNNDDIIDEKDKEFTNLLLWQDKNSNGISETDELIKLSDKAEFANLNLLVA